MFEESHDHAVCNRIVRFDEELRPSSGRRRPGPARTSRLDARLAGAESGVISGVRRDSPVGLDVHLVGHGFLGLLVLHRDGGRGEAEPPVAEGSSDQNYDQNQKNQS